MFYALIYLKALKRFSNVNILSIQYIGFILVLATIYRNINVYIKIIPYKPIDCLVHLQRKECQFFCSLHNLFQDILLFSKDNSTLFST